MAYTQYQQTALDVLHAIRDLNYKPCTRTEIRRALRWYRQVFTDHHRVKTQAHGWYGHGVFADVNSERVFIGQTWKVVETWRHITKQL